MMGYQNLSTREIRSLLEREKVRLQIMELACRASHTEEMHDRLVQNEDQIWELEYSLEKAQAYNLDEVKVWILR